MAAFNMDNGRHRNAATVAEAQANGQLRPVTGIKVTIKLYTKETAKARRTRHVAATGQWLIVEAMKPTPTPTPTPAVLEMRGDVAQHIRHFDKF